MARRRLVLWLPAAVLAPGLAGATATLSDELGAALFRLAVVLLTAKVGGEAASRLGQPAVLGELVAGIGLGNLGLVGLHFLDPLKTDASIDLLARIGVVLLLFEVGLESTVAQILRVGASSLAVAVFGVVAPLALGWAVGAWFSPGDGPLAHAFLGAMLAPTSIGITARVLRDLGHARSPPGQIILGAAVIDDVLGLVILAVIMGAGEARAEGRALSWTLVVAIVARAVLFVGGSLALGARVSRRAFHIASRFRGSGVLLAVSLAFCFALASLAEVIGLAPIVGAFAAGLVVEEIHHRPFSDRGEPGLEEQVRALTSFLSPVFFVLTGARTDLDRFAESKTMLLAGVLTVAAVLGKQACALGVRNGGDRLAVALGMIPRGEVGLVFANLGRATIIGGKPLVRAEEFSAVVVMIMATTVLTPPALRWSFARKPRRARKRARVRAP